MINLEEMTEKYRSTGYSERNADACVCQDIVLKAIERSNLGRKLNCLDGIRIEIKGNRIEQLSQQEYSGKRVYIIIRDDGGNSIESKIGRAHV